MYKVLKIEPYDMTRSIYMQNLDTGTIDECFDDTDTLGDEFGFMKEGGTYDCKITIFGHAVKEPNEWAKWCRVVDRNVEFRDCQYVKVMQGNDIYYLHEDDVGDFIDKDEFYFTFTRKDLEEVDGIPKPHYIGYFRNKTE